MMKENLLIEVYLDTQSVAVDGVYKYWGEPALWNTFLMFVAAPGRYVEDTKLGMTICETQDDFGYQSGFTPDTVVRRLQQELGFKETEPLFKTRVPGSYGQKVMLNLKSAQVKLIDGIPQILTRFPLALLKSTSLRGLPEETREEFEARVRVKSLARARARARILAASQRRQHRPIRIDNAPAHSPAPSIRRSPAFTTEQYYGPLGMVTYQAAQSPLPFKPSSVLVNADKPPGPSSLPKPEIPLLYRLTPEGIITVPLEIRVKILRDLVDCALNVGIPDPGLIRAILLDAVPTQAERMSVLDLGYLNEDQMSGLIGVLMSQLDGIVISLESTAIQYGRSLHTIYHKALSLGLNAKILTELIFTLLHSGTNL